MSNNNNIMMMTNAVAAISQTVLHYEGELAQNRALIAEQARQIEELKQQLAAASNVKDGK